MAVANKNEKIWSGISSGVKTITFAGVISKITSWFPVLTSGWTWLWIILGTLAGFIIIFLIYALWIKPWWITRIEVKSKLKTRKAMLNMKQKMEDKDLKKLAKHHNISLSELKSVLADLDEKNVQISKKLNKQESSEVILDEDKITETPIFDEMTDLLTKRANDIVEFVHELGKEE